ncbi:unnamed protein product [Allacma fusca]|uniref:Uncharacterized protein n=1 Tax=Allacma fusca TaxID=39272 RepID=A0A8J2PAB4_9HEXA|nr:unnamed protein product [Allacma fusca]
MILPTREVSVLTKVIGWLQVIANFLSTIILGFNAAVLAADGSSGNNTEWDSLTASEIEALESNAQTMTATFYVNTALAIPAIIMAVLLLWGSYTRNAGFILAWMISQGIVIVVSVGFLSITLFQSAGAGAAFFNFSGMAVTILIGYFLLWIVGTHRKEIIIYSKHGCHEELVKCSF